jgi:ABC-2 type transport system ATP-binding protein
MTQRVVLAKTLLHAPRLLLLDEPASGMDPIARRDLRRVLQDVAATGASVVVSSHILTELAEMCTSVGIMHRGRLLRSGPIAEVLGTSTERVWIEMRVVAEHDRAGALLDAHGSVSELSVRGASFKFAFVGDERARADLLGMLVTDGIVVEAYSPTRSGIEQILMSLIEEGDAR